MNRLAIFFTLIPSILLATIHGNDDRFEAIDIMDNLEFTSSNSENLTSISPEIMRQAVDSTAAMIYQRKVVSQESGLFKITGSSLSTHKFYSTKKPLCSEERFVEQQSSASCSGALIGKKYILTAGHCIENMSDCENYRWVFDFKYNTYMDEIFVTENDVYSCTKIIKRSTDYGRNIDYAIIELDREVINRTPLKTRTMSQQKYTEKSIDPSTGETILTEKTSKLDNKTPLFLVGCPFGTPLKVTTNGVVIDTGLSNSFRSNIDNFFGNSGGPLINAKTGIIEGLISFSEGQGLVDGGVLEDGNKCLVSKKLPEFPGYLGKGLFIQSTRTSFSEIIQTIRKLEL